MSVRDEITIEDFAKLDLRVGLVLSCEKVENSDRLLKLEVDLGGETRTIVTGMAWFYEPDVLVGKKVIVVANLKPGKIKDSSSLLLIPILQGRLDLFQCY